MVHGKAIRWMSLLLVGCVCASTMSAEQGPSKLYGIGVHQYFDGQYELAIESFTAAIKAKSTDPRPFYFRGLAKARLKGLEAAADDFQQAADIEVNRADRPYDINVSLQRVQGPMRVAIEGRRAAARQAAAERKRKLDQARYEALKRSEQEVLFDPDRPAPKVTVAIRKIQIDPSDDPFASNRALDGAKLVNYTPPAELVVKPEDALPSTTGTAAPVKASNPFPGQDPKKAAAGDNPFGEMTPPAKSGDNPFGAAPVQAEADPFGQPPAGGAKAEEDPMGQPDAPAAKGAGDDNPFGSVPKDNPFGGAEPSMPAGTPGGLGPAAPSLGSLFDVLGKTLSGKSGGRDPFGDAPAAGDNSGAGSQPTEPPDEPAKGGKPAEDNPFK